VVAVATTDLAEAAEGTITVVAEVAAEAVITVALTTVAHVLQEPSSTQSTYKKRETICGLSFFILLHLQVGV
jgi:hypothetical protein